MKEALLKNKIYVVIIIAIVMYLLILVVLFKPNNDNNNLYIALSNSSTVWLYSNKKYEDFTNKRDIYNWLNYSIYTESRKIGKYQLYEYDYKWYVYDDNRKEITVDDSFIGFSGDINYENINFDKQELNDEDISKLNSLLKKNDVINYGPLTINVKIELDIDRDNKLEKIYCVSNIGNEATPEKVFSLVYIEDNSKISVLKKSISEFEDMHYNTYDINYIIDLEKDKKYEIIITYTTEDGICNSLYSKSKKEYIKQIGC